MNAVIFDFDGTIADSFDQVLEFLCHESGRSLITISEAEKTEFRGLSMRELATRVGIPAWKLPLTYLRGKSRLSMKMHAMQPFAGMPEVLQALQQEQYQMFIISSNSRRNIQRFLSQHGLGGYFTKVYGNAGWFAKSGALKRAMQKYRLKPETTVYVGDEVRDLVAAKVAGMPSIAVAWGFGTEKQLLNYGPTILVRKPAEIMNTLIDWGKTV